MVLIQKWPFSNFFGGGNLGQENVFYDILERKNAFIGYKNKNFKKSKILNFFKVVNPWFSSKNGNFSSFFRRGGGGNIRQEKVFYNILERKNTFLACKNKKFKKSKNWRFSKGVIPWFSSTNGHSSNVFKGGGANVGQENVFCDILERENAFLGYKNKKFEKSKNWHFSKGVNLWF